MPIRRLIVACLLLLSLAAPAWPDQPVIYAVNGQAIGGYDAVAYFTEGKAEKGLPQHKVMWHGATWYFASQKNREAFEANPRAYAPRYGGYCAYGMSLGRTVSGDPTAWSIHEGRLFLVHTAEIRDRWRQDIGTYVARANAHWPKALHD
ncbi:YHS domain-containing (seleno)protein [Albibacillus kandeliae]|uniref:YHS domain-containing (seleno)protein n=1 Tax=Albibacillus kandeliae TaxID=2174228 RepID=UPI000D6856FB|nr:YHS domain-containing (seleno)protein [Albibacillus kandeliae]